MLFSRIYNWIKYKTLPPSVLFTNRLFVERDSKHRRVTSNLGLTFRNSKWSTYARVNVNSSNRTNYVKLLFQLLFIASSFLLLSSFSTYYNTNLTTNPIFTLLWFIFDADLYLKVIFGSSLLCIFQITISSAQSQFLSALTGNRAPQKATSEVTAPTFFPKHLHKPILYSWLTKSSSTLNLEDLMGAPALEKDSENLFLLLKSLYSSVGLLRQSNHSLVQINRTLKKLGDTSTLSLTSYLGMGLPYSTFNSTVGISSLEYLLYSPIKDTSSSYFNECSRWSLETTQSESARYALELKSVQGVFYATDFSHSALNDMSSNFPELSSVRASVENQLLVIRWQRWLYKYNILHRSVLKNTQYLTSTKGLLSSGFYSSSLSDRNIWASRTFSDAAALNVSSMHSAVYGNYSELATNVPSMLAPSKFFYNASRSNSLSFYELSYHWFIQRFYQLNNLSSSGVNSTVALSKETAFTASNLNKSLNTSSILFDVDASLVSNFVSSDEGSSKERSVSAVGNYYLNYSDSTFLTKIRTEQISNLTKTRIGTSVPFYVPTKVSTPSVPKYN